MIFIVIVVCIFILLLYNIYSKLKKVEDVIDIYDIPIEVDNTKRDLEEKIKQDRKINKMKTEIKAKLKKEEFEEWIKNGCKPEDLPPDIEMRVK